LTLAQDVATAAKNEVVVIESIDRYGKRRHLLTKQIESNAPKADLLTSANSILRDAPSPSATSSASSTCSTSSATNAVDAGVTTSSVLSSATG
jgi:hypothetical protein